MNCITNVYDPCTKISWFILLCYDHFYYSFCFNLLSLYLNLLELGKAACTSCKSVSIFFFRYWCVWLHFIVEVGKFSLLFRLLVPMPVDNNSVSKTARSHEWHQMLHSIVWIRRLDCGNLVTMISENQSLEVNHCYCKCSWLLHFNDMVRIRIHSL